NNTQSNTARSASAVEARDRMNRRAFLVRIGGFAALPLLAACAPLTPATPTSAPATAPNPAATSGAAVSGAATTNTPAPAARQPKNGGVLRAGTVGEYVTLDGHYYSPKVGLATWIIYDTL